MASEAFGVRATCRRFGRARSASREAGTEPRPVFRDPRFGLTTRRAGINHLLIMSDSELGELRHRVIEFARSTDVPEDSFLINRLSLRGPEQVRSVIDGLTLSLISYCYHQHPRGENVHEVMEQLESAGPGTEEVAELERRADDAAALQIPFIVTVNKLVEEYYDLRNHLEKLL
jgi:hypothetical protein